MWHAERAVHKLVDTGNSREGMQSAIFGPAFWMTIHITSFNYPVEPTEGDKQTYANWLLSIGSVLPCRYCRENFPENLRSAGWDESLGHQNPAMQTRHTFSRFCYDLHDCVNRMLHKTSPPYEQVRETYELLRAKCLTEEQKSKLLKSNTELGCIRPTHSGKRGKCVISIVPQDGQPSSLNIDDQCRPL